MNRKARLAILLTALGATVVFAVVATRPPRYGPAGPEVRRAPFSASWSSRPVVLVGIGDSVTRGFGARAGYSYFDRLAANPPDEFADMRGVSLASVYPRLRAENRSWNGSTSDAHVLQIEGLPKADAETFGVVVMTTGGNDLIHAYGRAAPREFAMYGATLEQARPWIAAFEARLDGMLQAIEEKFPGGCRIFLATIYDPTDGRGDIESAGLPPWSEGLAVLKETNDAIRRAAARRPAIVHLVDLHALMLGHGIRERGERRWYHENVEDPNESGYDAIRRLMLIEMAKVLAPGK